MAGVRPVDPAGIDPDAGSVGLCGWSGGRCSGVSLHHRGRLPTTVRPGRRSWPAQESVIGLRTFNKIR